MRACITRLTIYEQDYSYLMFTYRVANPPVDMSDTARKFIFTGSPDTIIAPYIRKNLFIPVEQLRIRLCGTKKEREQAYMMDWLTFCAPGKPVHLLKGNVSNLKAALPSNYGTLDMKNTPSMLYARDTAGGLSLKDSANFIATLLEPNDDIDWENLPQFIFKRWCRELSRSL